MIEHELVCPLCRGALVLDGPNQCTACTWASASLRETVRSGRTRARQDLPWQSPKESEEQ